jgi:uncharacterized membrane protein YphA (DoxX/SURF4 family)/thiol-disulfide isomerase/thioredoxin
MWVMDDALIVARLILAGVFAVAGLAKLADRSGSRQALQDFGVPSRHSRWAAVALPATELLAAVLLVLGSLALEGAILAALLLAAFIAGISRAMARGEAPQCHCFGQLHSSPAGTETVIRNAVLLVVAIFVAIAGPGPSLSSWVGDVAGAHLAIVLLALAVGAIAYVALALWRENHALKAVPAHDHMAEPVVPAGAPAPPFSVLRTSGARVTSSELLEGRRVVLLFMSTNCGPCLSMLPLVGMWREALAGRLDLHILMSGERPECAALESEHRVELLVDDANEASNSLGVQATPSAIEIDVDGRVVLGPVGGAPAIEALIRASLKRPGQVFQLKVSHAGTT